jgi:hypothetical protein
MPNREKQNALPLTPLGFASTVTFTVFPSQVALLPDSDGSRQIRTHAPQ